MSKSKNKQKKKNKDQEPKEEKQQQCLFSTDSDDTTYIGVERPELLINFLMNMGLDVPTIHSLPYYPNDSETLYAIKTEDLPNSPGRSQDISMTMKRIQSYGAIGYVDQSMFGHRSDKMTSLVNCLVPTHSEEGRGYSELLLWCETAGVMEKVLDVLFTIRAEQIKAAQLKVGGSDIYLIHAMKIESPVVLARFADFDDAKVFYRPINVDIWMEWGWRYDFIDEKLYKIFQPDSEETIFIFKDNSPEKIKTLHIHFKKLIEFMKLQFDIGTSIEKGDPRDFDYTIERDLKLKRNSLAHYAQEELEELLQQEHDIQEKIEWLRNMEGIFKSQVPQKIMFYPLSSDHKDPVFPRSFFRNHSLYQLRQFRYFYGNMLSLRDGILVADRQFIENPGKPGFNIARKYEPRDGMIFESCRDWASLTGLRVMVPARFDLYPYLEINKDDNKIIVQAFLDTIGRKIPEEEKDAIRANPEKYIYFIFPDQNKFYQDEEKADLEGLVLHEDEFRVFDIKIANLGIDFALKNEERDIANRNFTDSVVRNISAQFQSIVNSLSENIEIAFQKERLAFKEKIEAFIAFMKKNTDELKESRQKTKNAITEAESLEKIIVGYEGYLGKQLGEYTSLTKASSEDFMKFMSETRDFMTDLADDIDILVNKNMDGFAEKLGFLKDMNENAAEISEDVVTLQKKRDEGREVLEKLRDIDKQLAKEFNAVEWNSLNIIDDVTWLWSMDSAFRGMKEHMDLLEKHAGNYGDLSGRAHLYSSKPEHNYDYAEEWFNKVLSDLNRLRRILTAGASNGANNLGTIIKSLDAPVNKCIANIENALENIKQLDAASNDKKETSQAIKKQTEELKDGIKRISSRLYN